MKADGNYLGAHSNEHLLYCDWTKRDSLLLTKDSFQKDLKANYQELKRFGVSGSSAHYFLPPYEWYNDSIATWTNQLALQLVNYTPGTLSHADYTIPGERNYRSSEEIYQSITRYEQQHISGLKGFLLLIHIGTDPRRTDKFYYRLPELIDYLKNRNYKMVTVKELLTK